MNVKNILELVSFGYSFEEIKALKESGQVNEMLELLNGGIAKEDIGQYMELTEETQQETPQEDKPKETPQESKPDAPQEETIDYKAKYDELLKKTQLENQRKEVQPVEQENGLSEYIKNLM